MPLMDFDKPETWAFLYSTSFTRDAWQESAALDALGMIEALKPHGLETNDTIAFIGSGYGWIAEHWSSSGYPNVAAFDTSSYIHANKADNALLVIHNEDGLNASSQARMKSVFSIDPAMKIDWVITEDVIPCLSDEELQVFLPAMRMLGKKVVHWTSLKTDGNFAPLNWKTSDEWKTFIGADLLIPRSTASTV